MGRFPSDLVQPAAAPDFLQLPAEPGRGRAAAVARRCGLPLPLHGEVGRREVRTQGWSEERRNAAVGSTLTVEVERSGVSQGQAILGPSSLGRDSQTYDLGM